MNFIALTAYGTMLFVTSSVLAAELDETFIKTVIGLNLSEIQAGELAQTNGLSDGIRRFGETMKTDHSAANDVARALARKLDVADPVVPSVEDQKALQQLSGLSGATFDKFFAQHMVAAHEKAVQLFTLQTNSGDDAVRNFVDQSLPALKHHLADAQKLLANVGSIAPDEDLADKLPPAANLTLVEPGTIGPRDLLHTTVYDPNNRNLGEVNDVLLGKDGKIDAVVVFVGGEKKPVALAFDGLQFRRRNENNTLYLYTKFTKAQLLQAPKYDKIQYAAQRDSMRLHMD